MERDDQVGTQSGCSRGSVSFCVLAAVFLLVLGLGVALTELVPNSY